MSEKDLLKKFTSYKKGSEAMNNIAASTMSGKSAYFNPNQTVKMLMYSKAYSNPDKWFNLIDYVNNVFGAGHDPYIYGYCELSQLSNKDLILMPINKLKVNYARQRQATPAQLKEMAFQARKIDPDCTDNGFSGMMFHPIIFVQDDLDNNFYVVDGQRRLSMYKQENFLHSDGNQYVLCHYKGIETGAGQAKIFQTMSKSSRPLKNLEDYRLALAQGEMSAVLVHKCATAHGFDAEGLRNKYVDYRNITCMFYIVKIAQRMLKKYNGNNAEAQTEDFLNRMFTLLKQFNYSNKKVVTEDVICGTARFLEYVDTYNDKNNPTHTCSAYDESVLVKALSAFNSKVKSGTFFEKLNQQINRYNKSDSSSHHQWFPMVKTLEMVYMANIKDIKKSILIDKDVMDKMTRGKK